MLDGHIDIVKITCSWHLPFRIGHVKVTKSNENAPNKPAYNFLCGGSSNDCPITRNLLDLGRCLYNGLRSDLNVLNEISQYWTSYVMPYLSPLTRHSHSKCAWSWPLPLLWTIKVKRKYIKQKHPIIFDENYNIFTVCCHLLHSPCATRYFAQRHWCESESIQVENDCAWWWFSGKSALPVLLVVDVPVSRCLCVCFLLRKRTYVVG